MDIADSIRFMLTLMEVEFHYISNKIYLQNLVTGFEEGVGVYVKINLSVEK